MAEPIVITVPWDVARTADNRTRRGGHWAQRAKVVKTAREIARNCWQLAGSPTSDVPVRVSVLCRRGRTMDTCNIVGGLKPVLDGVFVKALTPDDTPKWLTLGQVAQETGKQWKGAEEVVLTVEPVEVQP